MAPKTARIKERKINTLKSFNSLNKRPIAFLKSLALSFVFELFGLGIF